MRSVILPRPRPANEAPPAPGAEGIGSLLLAATVVGSGVMAERLAGGNLAIALLANTAATVAVLATLIALLGPSAARTSIRRSR